MWSNGIIFVPATLSNKPTAIHYWIKHYKNPSKYGIKNGRISKLTLKIKGRTVCNYDRGWDVTPTCKEAEIALKVLLYEYDRRNE